MVAFYPFNGNANDESGNGNHGTVYGAILTSDRFGNPNSASNFDPNNLARIVVNDSDSLDLTTQFTFSAWINPKLLNMGPGGGGGIISKVGRQNGCGEIGYQFTIATPPTDPLLNVHFNQDGEPWAFNTTSSSPVNISINEWSHAAATLDNNEVRIYFNGEVVGQKIFGTKAIANSCSNLRISSDDNENVFFDGMIDEVRIYNRALSEEEIQQLYLGSLKVPVDVKPGACPNPANIKSKGNLPVAILGALDFDATQIDPSSVRLAGIAPIRSSLEDVATPFEPFLGKQTAYDCNDLGPDGLTDLIFKFYTDEIVGILGEVNDGDEGVLPLKGSLYDGTPIEGEDVVLILKKGKK